MPSRDRYVRLTHWLPALLLIAACGDTPFPTDDELASIMSMGQLLQEPKYDFPDSTNAKADDPQAAALGEKLFSDPMFSSCGQKACVSCHPPPNYVLANTRFATGCNGATTRNGPTLLNVAFNDWFYWDGRKDSLWSHAAFPLLNHTEMNATVDSVKSGMASRYDADYAAAFGKPASQETDPQRVVANFGKAIEAFLRSKLIRVHAPFDDQVKHFLASVSNGQAESDPAYPGLFLFVRKAHCSFCHKGPMLSDGSFHNLGVKQDVMPFDNGHVDGLTLLDADPYNGAGMYSDDPQSGAAKISSTTAISQVDLVGAFKTPSLRNVDVSPPYMHNGIYSSLSEVVDFYNRGGDPVGTFPGKRAVTIVPLGLSQSEQDTLVTLLKSLTAN